MIKFTLLMSLLSYSAIGAINPVSTGEAIKAEKVNEMISKINSVELAQQPVPETLIRFKFAFGQTSLANNCSSGSCYVLQKGNNVSSLVRGASPGSYTLTLSKTYATLMCNYNAFQVGYGLAQITSLIACTNCNSISFSAFGSTYTDITAVVDCEASL